MRYAPYLEKVSISFTKVPMNYTEMVLEWSEASLETAVGSYLEYIYPGTETNIQASFHPTEPILKFQGFPEAQAAKGTLNVTFSDGSSLENACVDALFIPWLTRLQIHYRQYKAKESGTIFTAASLSWQIDPLLMNEVDHYEMSSGINDNQVRVIDSREASVGMSEFSSGDVLPVTLTAIAYDGTQLGSISFSLYGPTLKLIPSRSQVSGIGYGKRIDPGGIQETYQVNHNKTLAQLTEPTQIHAQETRTLGEPLASMDPKIVTSSTASDYVNSFDPTDSNQPFDYSSAKEKGEAIAPDATATLQRQHQGNYTLNHGGTLNLNRTVTNDTQRIEAPQINNTVENYTGTFTGDTFSQTAENYYEQNENETRIINEHLVECPSFEEQINNLVQQSDSISIQADQINYNGGVWTHNGPLYINSPKINIGFCEKTPQVQPFVLPKRTPPTPPDQDYKGFVGTVYAETKTSRVLVKLVNGQEQRLASGASLYYMYLTGQYSYQDIVTSTQMMIAKMNNDSQIHSFFDTGYYNTAQFPNRNTQDDTFAKKAVASVIVNRAKKGGYTRDYYKHGMKDNKDIVAAYTDTYPNNIHLYQFNGYRSDNYNNAMKAMTKMTNNQDFAAITDPEVKNLYQMLWDIYYKRQVTTDANMYLSPEAQIEAVGNFPNWALTLPDFESQNNPPLNQQQLQKLLSCWRNVWSGQVIQNVSDDFAFLAIPGGRSLWP